MSEPQAASSSADSQRAGRRPGRENTQSTDPPARPEEDDDFEDDERAPFGWYVHLGLFVATFASVLYAGARDVAPKGATPLETLWAIPSGWRYGVPLMAILVVHEFSHYFAARWHKVDASLPFFIPVPYLSLTGTMGAVISMRGRIKSRAALLDIGASGPLGGMLVALPVLAYGLATSEVHPMGAHGGQEGQSLLYWLMKRIILGPIPDGSDVFLNSTAWAGWVGLLITALNLIPIGQLDGGHVAYALLGPRQNVYARWLHRGVLVAFAYNLVVFVGHWARHRGEGSLEDALWNSLFWLLWWAILHVMKRFSGKDHPPTEPGSLDPVRRVVAVVTLALFVLLFMPTPFARY